MAVKKHKLKIQNRHFEDIVSGFKTFEIRKNDRNFKLGDRVELSEYKDGKKTGRLHSFDIEYIFYGGEYGLEIEYCIFNW